MNPSQVLSIIEFIKGKPSSVLMVESKSHAGPLAEVLFESAKLYKMLDESNDLDEVIAQISVKNLAARKYFSVTGKKWLF